MTEEVSREEIENIINNNDNNEEPIKEDNVEEEVKEEIKEEVKEEIKEEVKPKAKAKSKPKAKPKVKIVKEPVETLQKIEEVVEEPAPAPVKIDKLKEIVKCPDCNMDMTVHTLKYIHKRRGFCKAEKKPESEAAPQPELPKQKITQDIVNDYIKENPDIISNYLRNERALKAQKKQMNARSLLNNAF